MSSWENLASLLDQDPEAYRRAVERLRHADPAGFEAYVDHIRRELERVNSAEDRPFTAAEVDSLLSSVAEDLGWSHARVVAEALLRLRAAMIRNDFRPFTPEEDPAKRAGRYVRRRSSAAAIVLGDVRALAAKAAAKQKPRNSTRPGRYRGPAE
jgi:hypothetical protein